MLWKGNLKWDKAGPFDRACVIDWRTGQLACRFVRYVHACMTICQRVNVWIPWLDQRQASSIRPSGSHSKWRIFCNLMRGYIHLVMHMHVCMMAPACRRVWIWGPSTRTCTVTCVQISCLDSGKHASLSLVLRHLRRWLILIFFLFFAC